MEHSAEPTCPECRAWLGVEPEMTANVGGHFLPPDLWQRDIGPCATKGCIGLVTPPETQCLLCRYKASQPQATA